jgi:phosphomannomutase/phosphoglucomutase
VFVAHDGRIEAAELAAEAIDGLRWAGCSVIDLGPATAPCLTATALTRGVKGSLLVGSFSDEPHEVAFSFWGPVGKPLSGPGLAPLERLLPSPAPRPGRSSGGYKRVSAAGEYLSQFSEYFHALRPLRLVINTSSVAIRGYLERLTAHEKREEARLLAEVAQYYAWVHRDHSPIPGPVGGFEKSWTFYGGDREATGVGAA